MPFKFYTPRRLSDTNPSVIQRNFDAIANGMQQLYESVTENFAPIPPSPAPSGDTGFTPTYNFGPNVYQDSSGTETNQTSFQMMVDFTKFGPSITAELTQQSSSAGGVGTFRIRVGGSSNTLTGLVALTLAQPSATLTKVPNGLGVFPNPGGVQPVKLSIKSSGVAQKALIQNMVLTFKG